VMPSLPARPAAGAPAGTAGTSPAETSTRTTASCGGAMAAGASTDTPCARQKSSRFCRLAATIGCSDGSDADAMATARR
jgi:hypothetical protein